MNTICVMCKKQAVDPITGKPWITIKCEGDSVVHGCSYICTNKIDQVVGKKYWDRVVNTEDFPTLRPMIHKKNTPEEAITDNDLEELMEEINEEDRIQQIEWDYEQSSSEDDWENNEY